MSKSLGKPEDKYFEQYELWRSIRAAIAGKYKVLQMVSCLPGPQYKQYPMFNGMSEAQVAQANACNIANTQRVKAYWSRGRLLNATGKTHEAFGGMVYSKEPEHELATRVQYMEENANGAGLGLRALVQGVTDEVLAIGRHGILVDMPSNESALTQAQMETPENAPRFIQFKAEQIIYTRISGSKLAEVRLTEVHSVQKNEYDWEDVSYIRRLVLVDGVYFSQLFDDQFTLVDEVAPVANGRNLDYIPFCFFGIDSNTPEYSKPTLYDIAEANIGHFVLDCDNRDNLHFHGQGMSNVFTSMSPGEFMEANPNGLDTGAKGANLFDQGDKVELLQLEASGAIPAAMLADEQRMIMAGAQLVTNASSTQTLGAKEIEVNSSTSSLKRAVYNISRGIEWCLLVAGEFLGDSTPSVYQLNTDFVTDDMSPEMITKHMELVTGLVLPKSTLYETARKVGFTNKTDEELAEEAERDSAAIIGMSEEEAIRQGANDAE